MRARYFRQLLWYVQYRYMEKLMTEDLRKVWIEVVNKHYAW